MVAIPSTRVMVVEDSKEYQQVVLLTLSLEPYLKVVDISDSGEDALEAFGRVSPDLVLLDFRLPGIDGLETAKRMKQIDPKVKIALVTAFANEVQGRTYNTNAVEGVIPKTEFSLARLQETLILD